MSQCMSAYRTADAFTSTLPLPHKKRGRGKKYVQQFTDMLTLVRVCRIARGARLRRQGHPRPKVRVGTAHASAELVQCTQRRSAREGMANKGICFRWCVQPCPTRPRLISIAIIRCAPRSPHASSTQRSDLSEIGSCILMDYATPAADTPPPGAGARRRHRNRCLRRAWSG